MCLTPRRLFYRFEGSVSLCHFPELLDHNILRSLAHFFFFMCQLTELGPGVKKIFIMCQFLETLNLCAKLLKPP